MLLVLALLIAGVGLPWARQLIVGTEQAKRQTLTLERVATVIAAECDRAGTQFTQAMRQGRNRSIATLDSRLSALRGEHVLLSATIAVAPPRLLLALQGSDAVLAVERQRLRLAWVRQEIAATQATRDAVASDAAAAAARFDVQQQIARSRLAIGQCRLAAQALRRFEADWRWWDSDPHKALVTKRADTCLQAQNAVQRTHTLLGVQTARHRARIEANRRFAQAASAPQWIERVGLQLQADARNARTDWTGRIDARLRLWFERTGFRTILVRAAIALGVIIATPFLIRLICYYILAPIAMRRPAIALRAEPGETIPAAARSAPSVAVRLAPGEELLVRQSYLQTESDRGSASTRFILDWRHPFTSLATGLIFLTRVRGTGETTTISATRDPFAEVTIITLPEEASCVLHPRALVAVAQPIARPLRVETQWRLTSLHAWLTLQLRYVIFHGPARLVVKGGRGVRVDRAEGGRVFGPDQLVGFSTDLAYSITRTRTFWPYLLGRESLLKDRVAAGGGVLIVEEAPLSARTGQLRRGLEGLVDTGMKAFGM